MEREISVENSKEKYLTDLNNDCLIYICSFLNPIERFRLALVSDIFDIAIEHFAHLYELRMDELSQNFTIVEVEEILKRFGEQIKRVGPWPDPIDEIQCNEHFHLVSCYCHNIEEIGICYPWNPDFPTYLEIFNASSTSIRKVIVYQKVSGELDDNLDDLFRNARSLRSLGLLDCDIKGTHLMNLVNLIELSLECCETVESEYFIRLCEVVKLKKLNLAGCRLLDDRSLETLCRTQTDLEELIISNNYACNNLEVVGRLKSLRKIEICECSKQLAVLLKLLDELVYHHRNDLETLHIASNFCYEKEAAPDILTKLSKFRNLRKMTIPNLNLMNNSEHLKEVVKSCCLLEDLRIIVFTNYQWLTNEAVLQLITLKSLRRLQIGPIFPLDASIMPIAYELLKAKKAVQLNIYLNENSIDDDLLDLLDTAEYLQNEKYLKIHVETVDD